MAKIKSKFTFLTLTYNHENYIFEHLESIKYQIENYGKDLEFQLLIADDCSKDKTIEYIEFWVSLNKNIFIQIDIISDVKNKGTCYNFTKVWDRIIGDNCKICAGDDIYSVNNLFNYYTEIEKYQLIGGLQLNLIDNILLNPKFTNFNIIASNEIYKEVDFIDRLKGINVINTPNSINSIECYKKKSISEFINKFKVTEDFSLHIGMAEIFKPLQFKQILSVFVYYRRTNSSAFIIKNQDFNNDKVELFNYLMSISTRSERFLLKNRKRTFQLKNRIFGRLLNLNYYVYLIRIFIHLADIIKKYSTIKINIQDHQEYYNLILNKSNELVELYKLLKT